MNGGAAILVIQHIWTKWTKRSRGADSPMRRPRLAEAYPLPAPRDPAAVFRHEIRALEQEEFAVVEESGATDRESWPRLQPHRDNALDWRACAGGFEIMLARPWRIQTRWPAQLPRPLFSLQEGETALIDWNGRFAASAMGSNRSTYYEQHRYWLAVTRAPEASLFLEAEPRKNIDLRAHIY